MNNTINSLREQIDLIDDEMTSLLVRRLNVCAEIAEDKRLSGAPVENLSREREVLARAASRAGEQFAAYAQQFFSCVMAISKRFQTNLLGKSDTGEKMQ